MAAEIPLLRKVGKTGIAIFSGQNAEMVRIAGKAARAMLTKEGRRETIRRQGEK